MQAIIYDMGRKWLMTEPGSSNTLFEEKYIGLRQKENRICSDEELKRLPNVLPGHPHYKEWKLRRRSCERLLNYVSKKKKPLRILEVGCGNGWLSHQLSMISGTFVTGIDINALELRQAARVFAGVPGLQFIYGGIDSVEMANRYYDIVVYAASIQYFRSLSGTIQDSFKLLRPAGELHILDSHFYDPAQLRPAAQRTEKYFGEQGFPEMAAQYFHHGKQELKHFDHQLLYRPSKLAGLFKLDRNPFPWVVIKKENGS